MLYLLEKSETCPVASRRRGRGVARFWKSMKDQKYYYDSFRKYNLLPWGNQSTEELRDLVSRSTSGRGWGREPSLFLIRFLLSIIQQQGNINPADLELPSMGRWHLQGRKCLKKIKMKIHCATSPSWHHTSLACRTETLLECVFVKFSHEEAFKFKTLEF